MGSVTANFRSESTARFVCLFLLGFSFVAAGFLPLALAAAHCALAAVLVDELAPFVLTLGCAEFAAELADEFIADSTPPCDLAVTPLLPFLVEQHAADGLAFIFPRGPHPCVVLAESANK